MPFLKRAFLVSHGKFRRKQQFFFGKERERERGEKNRRLSLPWSYYTNEDGEFPIFFYKKNILRKRRERDRERKREREEQSLERRFETLILRKARCWWWCIQRRRRREGTEEEEEKEDE